MSNQQEEIDELKKKLEKLEKSQSSTTNVFVENEKPMGCAGIGCLVIILVVILASLGFI